MASASTIGGADAPVGASFFTGTTGKGAGKPTSGDMGKEDFMKLLLAQLTNQDPLKPMDDQAFIAQVATFNQLEQLTDMNKTLEAVLDSQQLSEASAMIGKTVAAKDADAKPVVGLVTAASIENGVAMLHVGGKKVKLESVSTIAQDGASVPTAAAGAADAAFPEDAALGQAAADG